MTKHKDKNDDSPLTAYQVWKGMWTAIKEKQQETDLRLSDDLHDFIEQTKQLVTLAERENLDPSPLVLFLDGTERCYHGVGTGIPKVTNALRTFPLHLDQRPHKILHAQRLRHRPVEP